MIFCLSDIFHKRFLYGIVLIALAKDSLADRCVCNLPDAHYKELGCKPIFKKTDDCCPIKYDCSEAIKLSGEPGKCYINGKQYSEGDKIDNSVTEPKCIAVAVCHKDTWRDYIYAHHDCAEFSEPRLAEGCFRQYKLGRCCEIGKPVCPPIPKDLATCKVGDKTVYEGQPFQPEGDLMTICVCQKGYEGKNIAPFCKPVTCGIGLKSFELRRSDIPIYLEDVGCPISWLSKQEGKYENVGRKLVGELDENSCRFGNRVFKLRDKFKEEEKYSSSPEITCECKLPPLMTCYEKRHT